MLLSKSILIFSFFLPHIKLGSSVEFLLDSYSYLLVLLFKVLCLQILSLNVCSVSPVKYGQFCFKSGVEFLQEYTRFLCWQLPFNEIMFCPYIYMEVFLAHLIYFLLFNMTVCCTFKVM